MTKSDPIIKLTAVQVAAAQDWHDLDVAIKKLTTDRDAIKNQFGHMLEQAGARIGTFRGDVIVEMRPWSRNTIDTKRLKDERPELAEEYSKESSGLTPHSTDR